MICIIMKNNIVKEKSYTFALEIIELYKYLQNDKHEYVLSKQLLRSATSIGANIEEATYSISKKEFISKLQISLKESSETRFWLNLLYDSNFIRDKNLINMIEELIAILT
jgi:four helix bundle protein